MNLDGECSSTMDSGDNKANNSENKAKNSEVDQRRAVACNMGDNELLERSTKLLGCPSLHQLQQPESYIDLSL